MLLLLFFLPQVIGLRVGGQLLSPILYEPGKVIINEYTVSDTVRPIEVTLGGQLLEYINVTELKDNRFTLIIQFPDKLIETGSYQFMLAVREKAEGDTAGLNSLLSVTKVFGVDVYSHGKDIAASLTAPNGNVNSTMTFSLEVQSRGYTAIDAINGEITVYDPQRIEVGKVLTKAIPLPALDSRTLTAVFNTTGLLAGDNYLAEAVVFYDGSHKTTNATFNIGAKDIELKGYTRELTQGFSKFNAKVENRWGKRINNIYARLFLNGTELLQTPSISLDAWQGGNLSGIVEVNLPPNDYQGLLSLSFDESYKEYPVQISVILLPEQTMPTSETQNGTSLFLIPLLSAIGSFILLALFLLAASRLLKRRKRKRDEF